MQNENDNQEYTTYSDKEIQLATMIAYMNVTSTDTETYTNMQELMQSDRGVKIEEDFMRQYGDDTDTMTSDRRAAA